MSLPAPQCEGGQRTAQQGSGQRFGDCLTRGTKRDRFGPPGCVGRIRRDSDSEVRECSEQKVEVRSLSGIERIPESCVAGARIAIGKNDRSEGVLASRISPVAGSHKVIARLSSVIAPALRFTGIEDHLEVIEIGQSQRRRELSLFTSRSPSYHQPIHVRQPAEEAQLRLGHSTSNGPTPIRMPRLVRG